jgi:HEAT repeat protein
MSMFPQLDRHGPVELRALFVDERAADVPEDERALWLDEVAVHIARTDPKGVDFLLSCVRDADEMRLRSILLAMSFVEQELSPRKRARICELARGLLNDDRPMVVAEAVDTLTKFACLAAMGAVTALLRHPSPYVVGSALRFFARRDPEKAVPLLEKALTSEEPIVRENAVDELDEMNYTPALPKIKRLLRDPDGDVRQAARTAVEHLEGGSFGPSQ